MQILSDLQLPGGTRTSIQGAAADDDGSPVLLLLPAMGVAAGYYGPFIDALAAEGVTAAVVDYPGQGESRPVVGRRHDYGYGALATAWLDAAAQALAETFPGRPVVLAGHSLGGQVLLTRLARRSTEVVGAVLIGSGSPYWRAQPSPLTILVQTQTMAAVTALLRYWPGHRIGFGGRQPRTLVAEWARFARSGVLAPDGAAVEPRLVDVEVPLLAIDLDNDELAPPGSVDHLVSKLPRASVDRWRFRKDDGAPGRPVDHYSFARSPQGLVEKVAGWVRALDQPGAAQTS